jgi:hypothetical protein
MPRRSRVTDEPNFIAFGEAALVVSVKWFS